MLTRSSVIEVIQSCATDYLTLANSEEYPFVSTSLHAWPCHFTYILQTRTWPRLSRAPRRSSCFELPSFTSAGLAAFGSVNLIDLALSFLLSLSFTCPAAVFAMGISSLSRTRPW